MRNSIGSRKHFYLFTFISFIFPHSLFAQSNACASATSLTPGATCVTITGTVVGSSLDGPTDCLGATPTYDVWYKFVAGSSGATITLSSIGSNFNTPRLQLFSGTCAGGLTSIACSTPPSLNLTATGLTSGATYLVRVYSLNGSAPASNGGFSICVVNSPSNDDCNSPTLLTESATCSNTPGTLLYTGPTASVPGSCGNASSADVWYQFVATTSFPVISLSNIGSNLRGATAEVQLLSGACGSWTSLGCVNTTSSSVNLNTFTTVGGMGLTIGATYYVRISSNTNTGSLTSGNWGFNICITEPNDNCANAVTLTSATSCNGITGNMNGASLSSVTINGDCGGSVAYDVWYKFIAQTANPTITLSNIGSNIANPNMELLSNNCGGTFTGIACGTTSIAANYLTPGSTYYIRVYSASGVPPSSSTNSGFDICIIDPVSSPPSNDNCTNAVNLSVANTCSTVSNPGNMAGATPSSQPLNGSCAGPLVYDVWYRFNAVSTSTVVTLGSLGTNFLNPGIEVFSGNCAGLTSIACGGNPLTVSGLTTGTTYYIRVYSTTAPPPNGNARFNICLTSASLSVVRYGNSYVNVTKKTTGGVIEPGDTLEIRMTINHTSGTMNNLRFVDDLPTHTTMASGANDFIRIITNEGLTFRQYTPAADGDAATYKAIPGANEYNIRLNVGFASGPTPNAPVDNTNNAASANGQMNAGLDRPRGGGGMLFAIAYKVVVAGAVGDTVTLFPSQFIYNNGTSDVTLIATPFNILISDPLNLCNNSIGLNNAVEYGGTFGAGVGLNRGSDLTTPIAGYDFVNDVNAYNSVGDGRYAIVNNISPRSDPIRTARRVPNCNSPATLPINDPLNCNNRMHGGHWDIDGDHTGTNNAIGNVPPGATTPGGYMLMVNADYVASEVYRQTVSNLCPNTYYEFSAWVRNICKTCGIDSAGQQFTNTVAGVPPPPPNGYPGVLPNLTFTLNDLDFYNTGEIDTVGWLKKGFVFKTSPTQTTATFSIRNNAQGGGGNDWVLDDIAVATCLPSMMYSPSIQPQICQGNPLDIFDTVRSYFDNYTYYKWQRSVDGGSNWNDITLAKDTTLSYNGTIYQFITNYRIPATNTNLADSGDLYRVIVATLDSNLTNNACLYTDASTIITLDIDDCGVPLAIDFISFNGKKENGNSNLIWTTSKEYEPVLYVVERSYDGTHFNNIMSVPGNNNPSAETNTYKFTDANIPVKAWYRISMINKDGQKKYSRIIIFDEKTAAFGLTNVINPFFDKLNFEISISENSRIDATLISVSGKPVRKISFNVYEGTNSLTIPNTESLAPGMYILQIQNREQVFIKKVMKK